MNCGEARREIDESVQDGNWPSSSLTGHLKVCGECDAEWDTRQELMRHLGALREAAAAHRPSLERRARLMREFESRHPRGSVKRETWKWSFAVAAALLLMAGVGGRAWDSWASRNNTVAVAAVDSAADNDGQEGFIAVPYAPALASGEVLRVVRTELYPAALVSLGLDMDPSLTGKMPADLLVGEDGYPRAVRVSADAESNF